jgi:hypothetical protein
MSYACDCHKASADPVMHVGPFEVLDVQSDGHQLKSVERCRTCGNITVRFSLESATRVAGRGYANGISLKSVLLLPVRTK